ncbi:MAG TPA: tetratricopeptide repeat protein [Spirochaetota bacterium]|nr:tetratricopeptide repeat protein [Spirochaetota bacterium]HOM37852.1 tetratricopeptide repeat protein [Spirochaetota bacterium]HPQ48656.1 tetratricopeptide repeat protein [Spirochaetota bacterium]
MLTKNKLKLLEYYEKGLRLYREKKFEEALKEFEKCIEIQPEDGPSQLYLERCKQYIQSPPPADWDGVFVMKTK